MNNILIRNLLNRFCVNTYEQSKSSPLPPKKDSLILESFHTLMMELGTAGMGTGYNHLDKMGTLHRRVQDLSWAMGTWRGLGVDLQDWANTPGKHKTTHRLTKKSGRNQ